MNPSQADGRTLAGRYLAMLNDHDPDGVDGFVAVDYINHNPMVEDGREGNRTFWRDFFATFPDIETTMDDLVVAGDRVVGRFTYRGFTTVPSTECLRQGSRSKCVPSTFGGWRTGSS